MNTFQKGLNRDNDPKYQVEGTYRFALNSVLETRDGEYRNISCEQGTTVCVELPLDARVMGQTHTETSDIILAVSYPNNSELGIYDPISCTYTPTITNPCLNFDPNQPLNMIFKLENGCERVVYFTDKTNTYRRVNFSDNFSCHLSKYTKELQYPAFSDPEIVSGEAKTGAYRFAIRYLDTKQNATKWLTISSPVLLFTDNALFAKGNVNMVTSLDEVGSTTNSGKGIRIKLDFLDPRFNRYQIAIISSTSSTGAITSVDLSPIFEYSDYYTYTGSVSDVFVSSSLDEILVDPLLIDKVQAHAFADGRLFLAPLETETKDYALFQRAASKIVVNHIPNTVTTNINSASHDYTFDDMRFRPNEVKALGIVYVYPNGELSPAFHIPGRNLLPDDLTDVTADVDNVFTPPKQFKWELRDTSTTNQLAYYQVSNTYPVIEGCDGDSYWGVDADNNPLEGENIRHHKMPSHDDFTLTFTNVTYPPGITGHFFVYGRPEGNQTIIEQGYMIPTYADGPFGNIESIAFGPMQAPAIRWMYGVVDTGYPEIPIYNYFSHEMLAGVNTQQAKYLRVDKVVNENFDIVQNIAPTIEEILTSNFRTSSQGDNFTTVAPLREYYKIDESLDVARSLPFRFTATNTYTPTGAGGNIGGYQAFNYSYNVDTRFIKTDVLISEFDRFKTTGDLYNADVIAGLIVSLIIDREVYTNLFNLTYEARFNQVYYDGSAASTFTPLQGDVFLTDAHISDHMLYTLGDGTHHGRAMYFISRLYSPINANLRVHDPSKPVKYSYYKNYNVDLLAITNYAASRMYNETGDDEDTITWPEQYIFNKDFDSYQGLRMFNPVASEQVCHTCPFSRTIYYSNVDSIESLSDQNLIIKPNNYKTLSGDFSTITDLVHYNNNLYAFTDKSLYVAPLRPSTLYSDKEAIYIGTGEVLAQEFREVATTDSAYSGSLNFQSRVATEHGLAYFDNKSSRPLLINQGLNDISLQGLRNFFQEEGHLLLAEQFKAKTKVDYPHLSIYSPTGIGHQLSYDPRFKRLILHKRDYLIVKSRIDDFEYVTNNTSPINKLFFRDGKFYYNGTEVSFDNELFFENKSFTLSYSFITNSWVSFHSYLPNGMVVLDNNFGSIKDSVIYHHNSGPYQFYYDQKYPHIIEPVILANPVKAETFDEVNFTSEVYLYDQNKRFFNLIPNKTFTKFILYNEKQTTLETNLTPSTDYYINYLPQTVQYSYVDDHFRINQFRNYRDNYSVPMFSTEWSDMPMPFEYRDKVLNQAALDPNKLQYNLERIKSHYAYFRLFFNPVEDYKITTDLLSFRNVKKYR